VAKFHLEIEVEFRRGLEDAVLGGPWSTTIRINEGLSKPAVLLVVGPKSDVVKTAVDDLIDHVTKEIGDRDLDTADSDPILVIDALVRGLRGYEE